MKLKVLISALFIIAAALIIPPFSYAQPEQEELKIGLVPEINIFKQINRYRQLESYLSAKTGVKVNFTIISQYGGIIDFFYGLELDGAIFGSLTAALADAKLDIEPVARPVNINGDSTYRGYMFVRKDSGIKGFKDLKGKVMIYVDKATSAGYVFPLAYFKEHGVENVKEYLKRYSFAGSHDAAIIDVLEKEADVGAAKNTVYESLSRKKPQIKEELTIIAESEEFPSNGLWLSRHVDSSIRAKFKEVLLNMEKDPEGKRVLRKFGAKRFIKTTMDDYKGVYTILKKAGIDDLANYDYYNQ